MLEQVAMEMSHPVEKPRNTNIQKVAEQVDKLGRKFIFHNPKLDKNLGDWDVKKTEDTINPEISKRKLEFSKGKNKQHLTIDYENQNGWEFKGLEFTFADGRTKKGEELTRKEYVELSNFIFKFKIDRVVNAIINAEHIVVPATVAAIVAIGTGGFQANSTEISAEAWKKLLLGPPALSQPVDGLEKKTRGLIYSEIPKADQDFTQLDLADESKYKPDKTDNFDLGLRDNLKLVHEFFLPKNIKKDGLSQNRAIKKFLMEAGIMSDEGIANSDRFRYRQYESGGLPESLKQALERIGDSDVFPYSQDIVYGLVSALREFNTGNKLVTPERIRLQANATDKNLLKAYYNLDYDKDTGEPNFNKGSIKANESIKGNEVFGYVGLNDFLVTTDNKGGIVIGLVKDSSGVLISVKVWGYNELTGEFSMTNVSAEDFALSFDYEK